MFIFIRFCSFGVFIVSVLWGVLASPYFISIMISFEEFIRILFFSILWSIAFLIVVDICYTFLTKNNFDSMLGFVLSISNSLITSVISILVTVVIFGMSEAKYLNSSVNIALFGIPLMILPFLGTLRIFKRKEVSKIIAGIFIILNVMFFYQLFFILPEIMEGKIELAFSLWKQISFLSQSVILFFFSSMLVFRIEKNVIPSSRFLIKVFKSNSQKVGVYENLSNQAEEYNKRSIPH